MDARRRSVDSDLVVDVFFTNLIRGKDGLTPHIGKNGNWWIGDEDTGILARGTDGEAGLTPSIGENGNWWFGGNDSGTAANGIPSGIIVMWSGTVADIPKGWVLCDGKRVLGNGHPVPDLRGRFIVGYDPENADYSRTGETGGFGKTVLGTENLPRHRHIYTDDSHAPDFIDNEKWGTVIGHPGFPEKYGNYSDRKTSGDGKGLGNVYYTTYEGSSKPYDNRPPYYVLAFIIKI